MYCAHIFFVVCQFTITFNLLFFVQAEQYSSTLIQEAAGLSDAEENGELVSALFLG